MAEAKILVIRFSSIGDIVLTTPVVRVLKKHFLGGAEVHYITRKPFEILLRDNPYIDKLHVIDRSTNEILEELREERFDYIIDLHRNSRSAILKRKLGILSFTVNKINFRKWLLVNLRCDLMPRRHIVDRYLDTLRAFELYNDGEGLDYFIPEKDRITISAELPLQFQKGYVAFAMGAQHWRKKLPAERIEEVCRKLALPVVLLGGEGDRETANAIAQKVGDNDKVFVAAGKFNLNQSASLLQQSKWVIAHDTGLMHIAAALEKPIISVWGATVPEFGMSPYLPTQGSRIVQATHLHRRPCSKLGTHCKYRKCRCIEEIPVDQIIVPPLQDLSSSSTPVLTD